MSLEETPGLERAGDWRAWPDMGSSDSCVFLWLAEAPEATTSTLEERNDGFSCEPAETGPLEELLPFFASPLAAGWEDAGAIVEATAEARVVSDGDRTELPSVAEAGSERCLQRISYFEGE